MQVELQYHVSFMLIRALSVLFGGSSGITFIFPPKKVERFRFRWKRLAARLLTPGPLPIGGGGGGDPEILPGTRPADLHQGLSSVASGQSRDLAETRTSYSTLSFAWIAGLPKPFTGEA